MKTTASVSRVTPSSLWRGCACGGESKSEIPTVVQLLVVQSVPGAGFAWVDISINKIPCSNHLFSVPYFSSGTNLERDREVGESAFLLGASIICHTVVCWQDHHRPRFHQTIWRSFGNLCSSNSVCSRASTT